GRCGRRSPSSRPRRRPPGACRRTGRARRRAAPRARRRPGARRARAGWPGRWSAWRARGAGRGSTRGSGGRRCRPRSSRRAGRPERGPRGDGRRRAGVVPVLVVVIVGVVLPVLATVRGVRLMVLTRGGALLLPLFLAAGIGGTEPPEAFVLSLRERLAVDLSAAGGT